MNGTPTIPPQNESAPLPWRALVTAAIALFAALAVGVLTLGLGGGTPAVAQVNPGGDCVAGTFAYDAAEARRQLVFEAKSSSASAFPTFGFHTDAQDQTATLHAASHSWIVVFYRPGADTTGLRKLAADAVALQIPMVAAPRRQRAALVAITQSSQLTCATADAGAVREFAAAFYRDLAM